MGIDLESSYIGSPSVLYCYTIMVYADWSLEVVNWKNVAALSPSDTWDGWFDLQCYFVK